MFVLSGLRWVFSELCFINSSERILYVMVRSMLSSYGYSWGGCACLRGLIPDYKQNSRRT